jgi:hypothetical protein
MISVRRGAPTVVGILILAAAGCTTPESVTKFCATASTTLTAAGPVFSDMKQSCLREVNSRIPFGSFQLPVQDDPGCAMIGAQAEGAQAAAKILADYFNAINSVASFGAVKTASSDAKDLNTKTGPAVGADSPGQKALASIAMFLASTAASGYRQEALEKDLTGVSANISAVVDALVVIVQRIYIGEQLKSEEQKLRIRYEDFARGKSSPEVTLMLDDRWHADEQALEAKRASAQSLVTALQALSKGFAELAANGHSLKAKDVPALLAPYETQLQALIPQVQKAF